jgi:DNA repair protein RadD
MFLDQAEFRAQRRQDIHMHDWQAFLDKFLRDTELPVLADAGSVSHEDALDYAHEQYDEFAERRRLDAEKQAESRYVEDLRSSAKALENPNVRLVGLTATPYRMTTGMICAPENLLNHVCYEVGVRELIVQGYLCPLKSKAGRRKVDTSGLHLRGGEFIAGEVEALMDDDSLVRSACREIVEHTQDRHSVLIFASGVQHALHVQRVLNGMGRECGFVCGDTLPFDRAETLARFKRGELKYLVNVNVLTTGFDAPNIDCVALLRPTNSPGLYYQMVGRGFRLDPSKENCLVLDFGGNILRHGPVDALEIKDRASGNGEAPAKECPSARR